MGTAKETRNGKKKMVYSPSTKSLADMEKNIFGDTSLVTKFDEHRKSKLQRKSKWYR